MERAMERAQTLAVAGLEHWNAPSARTTRETFTHDARKMRAHDASRVMAARSMRSMCSIPATTRMRARSMSRSMPAGRVPSRARALFIIFLLKKRKEEMENSPPLMETPAAFARRLGVHKSTISRAIQSGRLTVVSGKLDVQKSLSDWRSTAAGTRPDVSARLEEQRRAAGIAPKDAPPSVATEPGEILLPEPQESSGLAHYTRLLLSAQNNRDRLALQMEAGKRFPLPAVEDEAQALGATLRGALERLVDQSAPRLAITRDNAERRTLLVEQVKVLSLTLRRELPRALRRLRLAGKKAA